MNSVTVVNPIGWRDVFIPITGTTSGRLWNINEVNQRKVCDMIEKHCFFKVKTLKTEQAVTPHSSPVCGGERCRL